LELGTPILDKLVLQVQIEDDKDGDTNYVHDFKGTQGRINQQRKALWFYGIWGKV
jgi:hypothetical protein